MEEIWKDVIGYEGYYKISNQGNLLGIRHNKLKKPSLNSWRYKIVSVTRPGVKCKSFFIHRLVAIHFIENPENKPQVNHIDGNKANNIYTNLEWCTGYENQQHAFKLGLNNNPSGEDHNRSILTTEILNRCIELREAKNTYKVITDIINSEYNLNMSRTTINEAVLGNTWSNINKTKNGKYRKLTR